jgi:hypothetical protein
MEEDLSFLEKASQKQKGASNDNEADRRKRA